MHLKQMWSVGRGVAAASTCEYCGGDVVEPLVTCWLCLITSHKTCAHAVHQIAIAPESPESEPIVPGTSSTFRVAEDDPFARSLPQCAHPMRIGVSDVTLLFCRSSESSRCL